MTTLAEKKPGFRFAAALACFALPLLTVAADDRATSQPLPSYVYRPTATNVTNMPLAGTPYASPEAEKAVALPAVQMTSVTVYASLNDTDAKVKDMLAQHDRMESHALIKQEMPGSKRLELITAPETPLAWSGRDSVFAQSAEVSLARWRW